ncbi:MAG: PAS domain-containing sensor histidine kinase [Dehalococcoidales bacterium]|nr:PAS domain-containing sensor histidine kinase [Dehalococcoidales bacterium]
MRGRLTGNASIYLAFPVVLLALLFIIQAIFSLNISYTPSVRTLINTLFLPLGSLPIAILVAIAVLKFGRLRLAWMGAGVIALGLSIVLANWMGTPISQDTGVKIQNLGVLVAGSFHLTGMFLTLSDFNWSVPDWRRRVYYLSAVFGGSVIIVVVVAILSNLQLLPQFFIPDQGGTILRNIVLTFGMMLFAGSALLSLFLYSRNREAFLYIYGLGLALVTLGQFAYLNTFSFGDAMAWLGRIGQWLGAIYFLIASIIVLRRTRPEAESGQVLERLFPAFSGGYRILIQASADAVIGADGKDKVMIWNPAAERMFGYTRQEAMGRNLKDITGIHIPRFPVNGPGSPVILALQELLLVGRTGNQFWAEISPARNESDRNLVVAIIVRDITRRKKAEEALARAKDELEIKVKERTEQLQEAYDDIMQSQKSLKEVNQQLKQYANKITQVQEEERKRIAYELHDDTAQYLSILKMQIGVLAESKEIQNPKVKEKLKYLEKDADRAFNDVRRYSHELRPTTLEHQGLAAALEQIADDFNKLGQISVKVYIEGIEPELSEEVKLGLFRIAQEVLNNARKHSKASQVDIDIRFNHKQIRMVISDNGEGFDTKQALKKSAGKGSLGLLSMRERSDLIGANLNIESRPGQGTIVSVDMSLR